MSSRPSRPDTREINSQAGLAFAGDRSNCSGLVSDVLTIAAGSPRARADRRPSCTRRRGPCGRCFPAPMPRRCSPGIAKRSHGCPPRGSARGRCGGRNSRRCSGRRWSATGRRSARRACALPSPRSGASSRGRRRTSAHCRGSARPGRRSGASRGPSLTRSPPAFGGRRSPPQSCRGSSARPPFARRTSARRGGRSPACPRA